MIKEKKRKKAYGKLNSNRYDVEVRNPLKFP
jgi:hypothetical protein